MVRFGPHLVNESAIRAVVLLPETVCDPERYSVHLGDAPHFLDVAEGTAAFEDIRDYVMMHPRQVETMPEWLNKTEVETP